MNAHMYLVDGMQVVCLGGDCPACRKRAAVYARAEQARAAAKAADAEHMRRVFFED